MSVVVPGTEPWTDTGIELSIDDAVLIEADGEITPSTPDVALHGPDGMLDPAGRRFNVVGLVEADHAGLIGRIGAAEAPFQVGSRLVFVADTEGRLFLGINDGDVGNNAGEFTATITVNPSGIDPATLAVDRLTDAFHAADGLTYFMAEFALPAGGSSLFVFDVEMDGKQLIRMGARPRNLAEVVATGKIDNLYKAFNDQDLERLKEEFEGITYTSPSGAEFEGAEAAAHWADELNRQVPSPHTSSRSRRPAVRLSPAGGRHRSPASPNADQRPDQRTTTNSQKATYPNSMIATRDARVRTAKPAKVTATTAPGLPHGVVRSSPVGVSPMCVPVEGSAPKWSPYQASDHGRYGRGSAASRLGRSRVHRSTPSS